MKKIEATIGYREVTDNGEVHYYCGESNEGYVYKDLDAFKNKSGICYIPEASFDESDNDYVLADDNDNCYDFKMICDVIRTGLASQQLQTSEAFVEYFAECMLEELDWCCPETWMNEVNAEPTLTQWLVDETKKSLSPQSIKTRSHRPDEDQTYGVVLCWMRDNLGVTKTEASDAAWQVLKNYWLENKHY